MESGGKLIVLIKKLVREMLCIVIKDSGCGIDLKCIFYIGEFFYIIKEWGVGLGLIICNKIINEYNGFFYVLSEENDGISIIIILFMKMFEFYVVEV